MKFLVPILIFTILLIQKSLILFLLVLFNVVVEYLWYRRKVPGAGTNPVGHDVIDEWGRVIPDPARWPSSVDGKGFSEVARKVHSMGLKFGIHIMKGISTQAVNANTLILDPVKGGPYMESGRQWRAKDIALTDRACAWMPQGFMSVNTSLGAARAFLTSLHKQYAEWGVDFVKHDRVFGTDLDINEISLVSKDNWRDWDKWTDVASHFDISRDFSNASMIGAEGLLGKSWPDLDMLPLGWLSDADSNDGPHRACNLNIHEQRTQMTLWCMAKSPIMFGGDMRKLDESTFDIIANPTLLEINLFSSNSKEFPHITANKLLKIDNNEALPSERSQEAQDILTGVRSWIATGRKDEIYVAFFNLNPEKIVISTTTSDLVKALPGRSLHGCKYREVWSGKNLGLLEYSLSMDVEGHGCSLFVLNCA